MKFPLSSITRLAAALALTLVSLAAAAQQLTVSAAASLTNVLKDLGSRYEAAHPGSKLQFNFAASGVLIQQIAQGAPVDLFISADEETVAKGVEQKLLDPASRRDIASNQVVRQRRHRGAVAAPPAAATSPPTRWCSSSRPSAQRPLRRWQT